MIEHKKSCDYDPLARRFLCNCGANVIPFRLGSDWVNVSVSHGTMIGEDIVDAVEQFSNLSNKLAEAIKAFRAAPPSSESDERTYILNEVIWDIMNELAPNGCDFGSHPGDGCDYGFWELEKEDL
jgi:hypothetical protein